MTKAKGRGSERKLPKIEGGPEVPDASPGWEPPQEIVPEEFPIILNDDNRAQVRLSFDGPQLADFCISQKIRLNGVWHEVIRGDCAHGTVHLHFFARSGREIRRRELNLIQSPSDIHDGYLVVYERIIDRWEQNARGFLSA